MTGIEVRSSTPEEMGRELETIVKSQQENKYDFQVGLKDLDFDVDEDNLHALGITMPFQSIDQAEQALRARVIAPAIFLEYDDTEHQVLVFDPDAWMGFGIIGLWVLVVNWLALGGGQLPRILIYVGLAAGVVYWLVVAGMVLSIPVLVAIAAGLGGIILGPIWYIWTGIILRQTSKEAG